MKKFISGYLHFNSQERNGLIVILLLIGLVWSIPTFLKLHSKEKKFPFISAEPLIDSTNNSMNDTSGLPEALSLEKDSVKNLNAVRVPSSSATLHTFDPNTVSAGEWKQFGISDHAIHAILNYRSKGGTFHTASDLKKIYGLSENDFNRLLPFIAIADSFRLKEEVPSKIQNKNTISSIEINTADSLALVALPGIGPVLAMRIMKYRNNLGGFYSVEQLKEVYGITSETFEVIAGKVLADSSKIQKIDINHISLNDLQKHFYFHNPIAKAIISYRDQH